MALARAIVLSTDVLLLDEPTANLDPYNVSLIESIVKNLNEEKGTTILMVTHNVFQARRLGTHAALASGWPNRRAWFGGKILHKTRGYTHLRVHPR